RPALPRTTDPWEATARRLADILKTEPPGSVANLVFGNELLAEAYQILSQLDGKLQEFDEALAEEPRTIDRARSEYLEVLARYAEQLALRLREIFQQSPLTDNPTPGGTAIFTQIKDLTAALIAKTEERSRRTWTQRFSWAAADGRQLRFHHLLGLHRCLDVLADHEATSRIIRENSASEYVRPWLRAEADASSVIEKHKGWSAR